MLLEAISSGCMTFSTNTSWSIAFSFADTFAKGAGYYSYTNDMEMKGY